MALSDDQIVKIWSREPRYHAAPIGSTDIAFARDIEAEVRRDALEEAAQLVEKSTYRKRWAKAAVNSQASNVPPCELAAAIRKLKEDTK